MDPYYKEIQSIQGIQMKNRFLFFVIIITVIITQTQCSIEDWVKFSTNQGFEENPNWDLYFKLPILERRENLSKYIKAPEVIKATTPDLPFPGNEWPPSNAVFEVIKAFIPDTPVQSFPALIDFDGDSSTDFTITGLSSNNGYLEIKATLMYDGALVPLEVGDLGIEPLTIEDVQFAFDDPLVDNGTLVFKTKDFLTDYNELDIIGNQVDFKAFSIILNPGNNPARRTDFEWNILTPTTTKAKLIFEFNVSFGDDWAIKGDMMQDIELFSMKDQALPIESLPISIDPIIINLGVNNPSPIFFEMDISFKHDDGLIQLQDNGNDFISIPNNKVIFLKLSTSETIFDRKNLKMDMIAKMKATNGVKITNNIEFLAIIGIEGNGLIDTNKIGSVK